MNQVQASQMLTYNTYILKAVLVLGQHITVREKSLRGGLYELQEDRN